ncbi:MAG: menaquinone biosynthesis family protein [Terriglobia bacterium]
MATETQTLTLAHSPDADDAFMFYALVHAEASGLDTAGLHFEPVLADIETLNQKALRSTYDVTAISFHAYAYLAERYRLLRCGASFGEGYGPLLVAREPLAAADVNRRCVAIPGKLTSAYLLLELFAPDVETLVVPFDRIPEAVRHGTAELGLLIHEGQLTYADAGLHAVADLGAWWKQQTGLPVPLGGNAVRRELPSELVGRIAQLLTASIRYALEHRREVLDYALGFGRGLSRELGEKFVGLYVNRWTLDCGRAGHAAIQELLDRAYQAKLIPQRVLVELVPFQDG